MLLREISPREAPGSELVLVLPGVTLAEIVVYGAPLPPSRQSQHPHVNRPATATGGPEAIDQ